MPRASRAQYFRDRRANFKAFAVEIEKSKMERLEEKLNQKKISKVKWLNQKIDEELGEEK